MTEAEKATAILNLWTEVQAGGESFRMRRQKLREMLEQQKSGGIPTADMIQQVTQRRNGDGEWHPVTSDDMGDLDIEVFSDLMLKYRELHARAYDNFQKALPEAAAKGEEKESNGSSTGS